MVTAAMKLKDACFLEEKLWPTKTAYRKAENVFCQQNPSSQSYDFLEVMYGYESWTIKKGECQKIDAFEPWCCRRLLRVPWTARRSNQSILKEISPKYSLEGLILKLKLQSFGYLMRRADSLEKTLMLGKNGGGRRRDDRGWDGWMASLTQRTRAWVSSGSWWRTGKPGELQSMGLQRVRHDWATELNWEDNHL